MSQTHTSLHTCWLQTITSNLSGGEDFIRSPCFIFESHLRDSQKVLDYFIQQWQADLKGFASAAAWHRSFCSLGGQRGGCGWVVNIVSRLLSCNLWVFFSPLCVLLWFSYWSVFWLSVSYSQTNRYKHAEHLDAESLGVRSTFFVVVYISLKSHSCYHSFYSCTQVSLQMRESLKIVGFSTGIFCPYIVSFFPGCLVPPPLIQSPNLQFVSDCIAWMMHLFFCFHLMTHLSFNLTPKCQSHFT